MKSGAFILDNTVMDLLLDTICVVDAHGRFLALSAACKQLLGYRADELIGRPMIELVLEEDRPRTLQAAREIMAGAPLPCFENRYVRKDGQIVHVMWSARWSEAHQVRIAVARDITARKRSEERQAATFALSEAAHFAENLPDLLQRVREIIHGLLPDSELHVALPDNDSGLLQLALPCATPAEASQLLADAQQLLAGQPPPAHASHRLAIPLQGSSGNLGVLLLQGQRSTLSYQAVDRQLLHYLATQLVAFIERQQMLTRLQLMAQFDPLTGLPNRALLFDRLHTALERARRERHLLGLLFIDLDNFKQINDSLGHKAGDLLLQQVAQRLQGCMRQSDTVARLAGDEFVVLLEDLGSASHALRAAEKIRLALNAPFTLEQLPQQVLPSIGGALYPLHAQEATQLLQQADTAMYAAKRAGGNRIQLASPHGAMPGQDALPG